MRPNSPVASDFLCTLVHFIGKDRCQVNGHTWLWAAAAPSKQKCLATYALMVKVIVSRLTPSGSLTSLDDSCNRTNIPPASNIRPMAESLSAMGYVLQVEVAKCVSGPTSKANELNLSQ